MPEVPGAFSQARRLDQVAEIAADAVAALQQVDPATVEVEVVPDVDDALRELLEEARAASERAAAAQADASTRMREAVRVLRTEEGLTTRDVARLLGVSQQRVSQLG